MGKIPLRLLIFLLRIILFFIPKKRYEAKVARIKRMDEKNRDCNLNGWQYKKIDSTGKKYVHRYYYYPAENKNAPVFLLLHGLNFDGRTFLYMKELAALYSLIAYDFPEESDLYTGNIDDFVRMLDDFIFAVSLHTFSLAGVSFGGVVALRFAAKHPELLIKNLVIISTPVAGYNKKEIRKSIIMDNWIRSLSDYKFYWFMERMTVRFKRRFSGEYKSKLNAILRIKKLGYYRQVMSALRGYCIMEDAKKIRNKVLVIHGTEDSLFPSDEINRYRELISDVEIQMLEGGTHAMGYLEGEEIAKRIHAFCIPLRGGKITE